MTRTEQLALNLSVEYGTWNQYHRWYQNGRISYNEAIKRLNRQRRCILAFKDHCDQELQKEEYPDEYYWDTPESAENILLKPDSNLDPEQNWESDPVATQLSIFDIWDNLV